MAGVVFDPKFSQIEEEVNRRLGELSARIQPPLLTKAELPTRGSLRLAICTDEAGGEVLVFRDSSDVWRRVTDRAVVS